MVGEFFLLGEAERIRNLDALLATVNGRLPVVFGCSGVSIPQARLFARAAQKAGTDAIIAMAPARCSVSAAMDMFRWLAEAFAGPIILQNSASYVPLASEQILRLVEEVPQIEYIKEERPPGPRHIAEVSGLLGTRIKTIFGGFGGKFMLAELRRGANGCMPACEIADLLAKVIQRWWAGDEAGARHLHRLLLPLINLETYPFMRYMHKRRGVFTSLVERNLAGNESLDAEDQHEITILLEAVQDEIDSFPFGPE
jgi:4-hydroxy-tetrahydrodipicolinate synthase